MTCRMCCSTYFSFQSHTHTHTRALSPVSLNKWFLDGFCRGCELADGSTQLGILVARRDVAPVSSIGQKEQHFQPIKAPRQQDGDR